MILTYQMRRNAFRLIGERSFSLGQARGRVAFLSAVFIIAYTVLAVRAFDLSIIRGRAFNEFKFDAHALIVQKSPDIHEGVRGKIYDRNGALLASSLSISSLYADPRYISDPRRVAQELAAIFPDLNQEKVFHDLSSKRRFIWVKRHILPEQQRAVLKIGEPGLGFQEESKRLYPQGNMLAHILGYSDVDGRGQAGLERSFEGQLGEGQSLELTIDLNVQHLLRQSIQNAIDKFEAKGGVGLVMDVHSGDILAGVSLPDFDPHKPGQADNHARFNGMTLGVYELGSIFKIFSTAALLEFEAGALEKTFDAREPIKIGRFTINDFHPEDRVLSVPEVFIHSSNIGTAKMAQMIGTERLRSLYSDLGLIDPLDFDIKEVSAPLIPSPWREVNTLTASYGHGIASTPLQVLSGVASLVNGGLLVEPRLVVRDETEDTKIRIVSEETSLLIRELMRLTVTKGTAKSANVPGYMVGGKTGTAEKINPEKGGYDKGRLISSFVAVFPSHEPRYAVLISVDEPKGQKESFGFATAGWVAVPAMADFIERAAPALGVMPVQNPEDLKFGQRLAGYIKEEND